ncbi:Sterol desaturase [Gloeomargarita lithophora Alchichica-D10]|uniref:Sterol desaturase n=1 Tax=Gloeomargarita lithophora Alchichica-D10 TaxID=1188229 RepID=A0A1J0AEA0_9CYAN|nr:sterol desaturase family protein [Gloeomargarita lithophora]APB34266.1 Sterol desaturase [Gloeomargarita lithophora Alchichica-D10]
MQYVVTHRFYWVFFGLILVEFILVQRSHRYRYSWKESLASLGVAIGHGVTGALFKPILLAPLMWVWNQRLFTLPLNGVWDFLLLFIGIEFFYYWYHRASHEVRWFWATHAVHHSAKHLNLSAAYRLGWTGLLSGYILFFLPLIWLGVHPLALLTGLSLNLIYQFWIHTELVPKLGVLEWFLNTPSHHRVHHAANSEYIDRNYGGVLIIFDRWFGTFTSEKPDCPAFYGLTHPLRSYNPVTIAFYEWRRLFQDLVTARSWRNRCRVILGRPT